MAIRSLPLLLHGPGGLRALTDSPGSRLQRSLSPEPLERRKVAAHHKEPRPRRAASPQLWAGDGADPAAGDRVVAVPHGRAREVLCHVLSAQPYLCPLQQCLHQGMEQHVAQSKAEGEASWCGVPTLPGQGQGWERDRERLPGEAAAGECCSMLAELPPTGASTSTPALHPYSCASTRCQECIFEQGALEENSSESVVQKAPPACHRAAPTLQLSAGSGVTWGHTGCHGRVMLTMGSTAR